MSKAKVCIRHHNIKELPARAEMERLANNDSCFGWYIPVSRMMAQWKDDARTKKAWVSVKRRTHAKAIKEFKELYAPESFLVSWHQGPEWRDDSIEVFYREAV
jgi:hypothetical protein